MEQKQDCCLLDLSPKCPWLVVHNLEAEDEKGDQIIVPIHDPLSRYQFRIPELMRRCIQGCFHGWVILSNYPHNIMWSLWNPVTSKVIHLPPLMLNDVDSEESIEGSCLSGSPDDPGSILLLTRHKKHNIVFYRLHRTRKRLQWTELSYAKQLRRINGAKTGDDGLLHCLACCDGKVYALNSGRRSDLVIHIDIVVKDDNVVINLVPFVKLPYPFFNCYSIMLSFLKGSGVELFYMSLGFHEVAMNIVGGVCLYKLNMSTMLWEELEDLKDGIFFIDLAQDLVFYRSGIATEFGGYIHIVGEGHNVMQSLRVKDKTVSLSSMPCLVSSSRLSLWECRLLGDHGVVDDRADSKQIEGNRDNMVISVRDDDLDINSTTNEENNESHLLNIPVNVLEMIMELCVGVEYLNFRATCKTCRLGAPMIRWSKGTMLSKLQTPWLVVINHHQGLITFTDPMFGNNYFIKTPPELIGDMRILNSGYGWLLIMMELNISSLVDPRIVFFNPFTRDIRELPRGPNIDKFCFSAPPTSPDCMVVGFSQSKKYWHVYVHFVAGEPSWRMFLLDIFDANPYPLRFPTFRGPDLYALCNDEALVSIQEIEDVQDYSWDRVTTKAPMSSCWSSTQYFLVKGDETFLLVKLGEFGESIEVFKLNDSTKEWEKIGGLGRHVIYICDTTCIYMETKTQEMENKIYFPRLHSENQKIVFYLLETCTYHTSNGKNMKENFFGTEHHTFAHTWIEPNWS